MRIQKTITGTFLIPNDPDGAEITVKHLTPGEIADVEEELGLLNISLREDDAGSLKREGTFNTPKGDARYIWVKKAVTDWKNVLDADGKPLPCTDEAKVLVARADSDFGKFVGECREQLAGLIRDGKERAAKNS